MFFEQTNSKPRYQPLAHVVWDINSENSQEILSFFRKAIVLLDYGFHAFAGAADLTSYSPEE